MTPSSSLLFFLRFLFLSPFSFFPLLPLITPFFLLLFLSPSSLPPSPYVPLPLLFQSQRDSNIFRL